MTTGSRRVSVNDPPALLPGGLPLPAIKLLTAAFLLYSSSTARLLRLRMNRNRTPATAEIAASPSTTPTAMPVLLAPPDEEGVDEYVGLVGVGELLATIVTVWPPTVIIDGLAVVVEDATDEDSAAADVPEESAALETDAFKPVR